MENNFITIFTDRGNYVHVNTGHISAIESHGQGCLIYVQGSKDPYVVKPSMNDILKQITESKK